MGLPNLFLLYKNIDVDEVTRKKTSSIRARALLSAPEYHLALIQW